MLCFDPCDRISAEKALQHPFLKSAMPEKEHSWRPAFLKDKSYGSHRDILRGGDLVGRWDRFASGSRIRSITAIASVMLLDEANEDYASARNTFLKPDTQGDGFVRETQLRKYLEEEIPGMPTEHLNRLLRTVHILEDSPTRQGMSQNIGYTAFMAATLSESAYLNNESLCLAVFDLLDADHDGAITASDLRRKLSLRPEVCRDVIAEATCKSGSILHFSTFLKAIAPSDRQ